MQAIHVQHYLTRARDFLKGMDLLRDDLTEFKSSCALLGVHCAISYSDALRIGMGCVDLTSDDHQTAASDLIARLTSRKFEKIQGAVRLARLLARKNRIAYAAASARENEVEDIVKQAERFAFWAEEAGRYLQIEGW
jgi:hypothetical protein